MQLVHDVHERIAPADAVALAKGLEPFDLFFLEDPVPLEQLSWLRNLRQQTTPGFHGNCRQENPFFQQNHRIMCPR